MQLTAITAVSALIWGLASANPVARAPSQPRYAFTFSLNGRSDTPQYAHTYLYKDPKTGAHNVLSNGTLTDPQNGAGLQLYLDVSDPDDNPNDTGDHTAHIFTDATHEAGLLKYRCHPYTPTACLLAVSADDADADYWYVRPGTHTLWNHGNKPTGFFNCEHRLVDGRAVRALGYGKLREKDGELVAPEGCEKTYLYALPLER